MLDNAAEPCLLPDISKLLAMLESYVERKSLVLEKCIEENRGQKAGGHIYGWDVRRSSLWT